MISKATFCNDVFVFLISVMACDCRIINEWGWSNYVMDGCFAAAAAVMQESFCTVVIKRELSLYAAALDLLLRVWRCLKTSPALVVTVRMRLQFTGWCYICFQNALTDWGESVQVFCPPWYIELYYQLCVVVSYGKCLSGY